MIKAIGKSTGLAILLSIMVAAPTAFAQDVSEEQARMEALSYAPEGSKLDERFSQFQFNTEEYAEHELNDSWLGMPAYSNDGKLIGYIEDALLDINGIVEEIIVGLNEDQGFIKIKSEFAELSDENVEFNLSNKQIATLIGKTKLASLSK